MDFITCKCKCCDSILSLVQFLFSFVNINRFAKFPLAKNTDLVTQSFMSLHDNVKNRSWLNSTLQTFVRVLTHLKAEGLNILHIFGLIVFNYWNQINQITAFISVQFTEQLDT